MATITQCGSLPDQVATPLIIPTNVTDISTQFEFTATYNLQSTLVEGCITIAWSGSQAACHNQELKGKSSTMEVVCTSWVFDYTLRASFTCPQGFLNIKWGKWKCVLLTRSNNTVEPPITNAYSCTSETTPILHAYYHDNRLYRSLYYNFLHTIMKFAV